MVLRVPAAPSAGGLQLVACAAGWFCAFTCNLDLTGVFCMAFRVICKPWHRVVHDCSHSSNLAQGFKRGVSSGGRRPSHAQQSALKRVICRWQARLGSVLFCNHSTDCRKARSTALPSLSTIYALFTRLLPLKIAAAHEALRNSRGLSFPGSNSS
jgi:hypothetical protein